MYFNKEHTYKKSARERKEILFNIIFEEPIIKSDYKVVDSEEKIIAMYEKK